jgi:hypothetical protein
MLSKNKLKKIVQSIENRMEVKIKPYISEEFTSSYTIWVSLQSTTDGVDFIYIRLRFAVLSDYFGLLNLLQIKEIIKTEVSHVVKDSAVLNSLRIEIVNDNTDEGFTRIDMM